MSYSGSVLGQVLTQPGYLSVSFSNGATLAGVDALLEAVAFQATGGGGYSRAVGFYVTDGAGLPSSLPVYASVSVAPGAPSILNLGGDGLATTAGTAAVRLDQGVSASVSDPNLLANGISGGSLTVSIAGNAAAGDQLGLLNLGGIAVSGSTVDWFGSPIGTLSGGSSGSPLVLTFTSVSSGAGTAAVAGAIEAVDFLATSAGAGPRTVQFALSDGLGGGSGTAAVTVTVGAAPIAPSILNLSGDALVTTAGAAAARLDQGTSASVSDPNGLIGFTGGNLVVSISGNAASGDQLGVLSLGGIAVSGSTVYSGGNPIGPLSGGVSGAPLVVSFTSYGANIAVVGNLIDAIDFQATSAGAGPRTVTFAVSDGSGAPAGTAATLVTVAAAPVAPSILNLGGDVLSTTLGAAPAVIDQGTGATVSDAGNPSNVGGGTLTVIDSSYVTGDQLSIATVGGISVSGGTVSYSGSVLGQVLTQPGYLSVSFSNGATLAGVDALLEAVAFQATGGGGYSRAVGFYVTDGAGLPSSLPVYASVSVAPGAPSILNLGGDGLATTAGTAAVRLDQGVSASVSDPNLLANGISGGSLTVSIAGNAAAGDQLGLLNLGGIAVSGSTVDWFGSPIGTLSGGSSGSPLVLTFTSVSSGAGTAAVAGAIEAVDFLATSAGAGPRTVQFALSDGLGGGSGTAAVTVTVGAAPVAPSILNLNGDVLSTTLGATAVIDQGTSASVGDPNNPANVSGGSVTVTLVGNATAGDQLSLASLNGIAVSGTTVDWLGAPIGQLSGGVSGVPLVVTFTSSGAGLQQMDLVLDAVAFSATSYGAGPRTVAVSVADGTGAVSSAAVTASVVLPAIEIDQFSGTYNLATINNGLEGVLLAGSGPTATTSQSVTLSGFNSAGPTSVTLTGAGYAPTAINSGVSLGIVVTGATLTGEFDTATLTLVAQGGSGVLVSGLTTPGIEALNLVSLPSGTTAVSPARPNYVQSITDADLTQLTISGSAPVSVAVGLPGSLSVISATAATAPVSIVGSLNSGAVSEAIYLGSGGGLAIGGAAGDSLVASGGTSVLVGGLGADTLTGGPGVTYFRYWDVDQSTAGTAPGVDRITDFASGRDWLAFARQGLGNGFFASAPAIGVSSPAVAGSQVYVALASGITTAAALDDIGVAGHTLVSGTVSTTGTLAAAIVTVTSGTLAGTYLFVNDSGASYSSATDMIINITGATAAPIASDFTFF